MNKAKIKKEIEEIQQGIINDLMASRTRMKNAADLDENEPMDPEDYSRQNELGTMATRLRFMIQKAEDDLEYLIKIPLDSLDVVKEGALVVTNKYIFYVGIAVHPFDIDGKHIISISQDAPIYNAMRGKQAGDKFVVANRTYQVVSIE